MRTQRAPLVIAILTGVLLASMAVGTGAQDESPFVPLSGRVERTDDGYAITLPDGWIAQELTTEVHWALYGYPPFDLETPYLYAQRVDTEAECELYDFTALALKPPAFRTLDDAAFTWAGYRDDVHFLEIPAGEVACVIGEDRDGWTHESYLYLLADRWFRLDCWAPGPDEELWALAQSLELAPAE